MSKSAITPSFKGRTAVIEPGALPMTSFASWPTLLTMSVRVSTATTDGSRMMMPFPFIKIKVFAVPKSIPKSLEKLIKKSCLSKNFNNIYAHKPNFDYMVNAVVTHH